MNIQGLGRSLMGALTIGLACGSASAQCTPEWKQGLSLPGMTGPVRTSVTFDDGTGPRLYVAGQFHLAGGVKVAGVAKWTGSAWEPVGNAFLANGGLGMGQINTLAVYQGQLYAGGTFAQVGATPARCLARWNGTDWASVTGSGFEFEGYQASSGAGYAPMVNALVVFNNVLHIGGLFSAINGQYANGLGVWDGLSLDPISPLPANQLTQTGDYPAKVQTMAVYGGALFVGGDFARASSVSNTYGVARWQDGSWSSVGSVSNGQSFKYDQPLTMTVFDDDGNGPHQPVLVMAGGLSLVGVGLSGSTGVAVSGLAKWDGTSWGTIGAGLNVEVSAVGVDTSESTPALYAAGMILDENGNHVLDSLWRWTGSTWTAAGPIRLLSAWTGNVASGGFIQMISTFDFDGAGPRPASLIIGGTFDGVGSSAAVNFAKRENGVWSGVPEGTPDGALWISSASALNIGQILRLTSGDEDGPGPRQQALYAFGNFVTAGDALTPGAVVRLDSSGWTQLGAAGPGGPTRAMVFYDDGSGQKLYAIDPFGTIKRWDGSTWSLAATISVGGVGTVMSATVHDDDGAGPHRPAIYVAGFFTDPDGTFALNGVQKWDGTSVSSVESDATPGAVNPNTFVYSMQSYNGQLYAGGRFKDETQTDRLGLARWNGAAWQMVGETIGASGDPVRALAIFQGRLYVGGTFAGIGGVTSPGLASFDGTTWFAAGSGMTGHFTTGSPYVSSLSVANDGGGEALFLGGTFTTAGGVVDTNRIARWDGAAYHPLATGLFFDRPNADPSPSPGGQVWSIAGIGTQVYMVGQFNRAGATPSYYLAAWGCAEEPCAADFNQSGAVTIDDLFLYLNAWFTNLPSADMNGGGVTIDDLFLFLNAWFVGC